MLNATQNDLLTRTDAATPMGAMLRRFWLPVLLSRDLPGPDCPPTRVTVMGEKLVAFRDTSGRVGLVEPRCPHRGADLFWGRNEECGLRCSYHGLKFDVYGECLDVPTIAPDGNYEAIRARLRIKAYPARDHGDLIWAYLGPVDGMPALPAMEFATLPPTHRHVSKKRQESNWLQALEGLFDPAHVSFLHRAVTRSDEEMMKVMSKSNSAFPDRLRWLRDDPRPQFTFLPHEIGFVCGASRSADDDRKFWRISQFLMPNHGLGTSAFPGEPMDGQTVVPIDDHSCWVYTISWNPFRPFSHDEILRFDEGHGLHAHVDGAGMPLRNFSNDYLIDRKDQKERSYSGIVGISEQDSCVQESQGSIADRTTEHLLASDAGVMRLRRTLLDAVKGSQAGEVPAASTRPEAYFVRSGGALCPGSMPLQQVMKERFGDEFARIQAAGGPVPGEIKHRQDEQCIPSAN
ncbi:MAG: ring-hydroxylating oxygenase subunit alpha [Ramlibacter sp.]|nr:ring-hydroxylating oxygenase subunit alpha [Ramlibacter sp.]